MHLEQSEFIRHHVNLLEAEVAVVKLYQSLDLGLDAQAGH